MGRAEYGVHTYGEIEIVGRGGRIQVGKYCSIAGDVKAVLAEHRTDWVTTFPFCAGKMRGAWPEAVDILGHPHTKGPLVIGNDVWIGYGVMFLGGVTVGDGAVIGAGAVVAKNIPAYSVAAGNPAEVIKRRFTDIQIYYLLRIKWWDWPEKKIRLNFDVLCQPDIDYFIKQHDSESLGEL
ncbi:CatB-related O-acetyltransferase [Patescibacteria group bacterium]|uniref:Putative hexapeptide repeat-containing transferase n=1 Tax=viral metagenome TaxID=1070528 RepID=A0A6M3J950_9ZZZZ|nr:CatB-related O-acetyltransferase [Patescibacteria group bacterium]